MAIQNLVEQHILFIAGSDNTIDLNAILGNSLMQSLGANIVGNTLLSSYSVVAYKWNGTTFNTGQCSYDLNFLIQPSFQATVQQNIPNLQAAFPQYSIVTWGYPVSFGN